MFSKTCNNTKNNFRPKNSIDNYNKIKKGINFNLKRTNNEISLNYSMKNSFNYDIDTNNKFNKFLYRRTTNESNENILEPNLKKFVVQSKILQKKIIN